MSLTHALGRLHCVARFEAVVDSEHKIKQYIDALYMRGRYAKFDVNARDWVEECSGSGASL